MSDKTELKRDILVEVKNNPGATNEEIADSVGCSASYVSQVTSEYDDYDDLDALDDQLDQEMDALEDDLPDF